jgi:hypothetical protein
MIRHLRKSPGPLDHWLAILAIVLGGGAAIQLAYENFVTPRGTPVIITERPKALNDAVHAGQYLKVRVFREKRRDDCPVISQRLLINDMTRAVLAIGEVAWEGGRADAPFVDVNYQMPEKLPSGGYTLRVYLSYVCPEKTFYLTQPDVHFEVSP